MRFALKIPASWPKAGKCLAVLLLGLTALARPACANSNALWDIVHGQCVPDQLAHNSPAPCSIADVRAGYAILKDIRGKYQYLLIPTARVTGIEDAQVLSPLAPDYFAQAWASRTWLEHNLGHAAPRRVLSLAINSKYGRTQNQLHIHIDCTRPDVLKILAANERKIGTSWVTLALPPGGHAYRVRRIDDADLTHTDPFLIIAAQGPTFRDDMAAQTIILAGASFADGQQGFYLITGTANLARGNYASGSALQDPTCAAAAP